MKKTGKNKLIGLLGATACACLATACVICIPQQNKYTANAESVSNVSFDFSDATQGAEFSAAQYNYGWKVSDGKLIPNNDVVESSQIGYMSKSVAVNEEKYIAFDFYTAEQQFDIVLIPTADVTSPWTNTSVCLHAFMYGGTTPCVQLNRNMDTGNYWVGDDTSKNYLDGKAHRMEIASDGEYLTFKVDGTQLFAGVTGANWDGKIPADEVHLMLRGNKGAYVDNLYIGEEKPAITNQTLAFDGVSDGSYFSAYGGGKGWSASDGIYKANEVWASVNTTETLDLSKDWLVKFDMYLPADATEQQFNVGFHSDIATAAQTGTGTTYSMGPTIWISSNFGRGKWMSENTSNFYTASVHSVEIQIVSKAISLFVDGVKLNFLTNGVPYQAVATGDSVYMLLQSTNTEAYIDNLVVRETTGYSVVVKDMDGALLSADVVENSYVLSPLWDDSKGTFIGYNVNDNFYPAGMQIDVTEDTEIVAVFAKLIMDEKASIRLDDPSGLRFTTSLDNDTYTYLQSVATVSFGTLITKADYFANQDFSGFTKEFAQTKLDIASKVGKVQDGEYIFRGVIAKVKSNHYDWVFASRGYMTVNYDNGASAIFYTNVAQRSISQVADLAYKDRKTEYDETVYKYLTADGDYSRYTTDQLKLLKSFTANS